MGFRWTFSLFSYSVPKVPRPRSTVSLMTVGEQSIACTPPNIARRPLAAGDPVREKRCSPEGSRTRCWLGMGVGPYSGRDLVWSENLAKASPFYISLRLTVLEAYVSSAWLVCSPQTGCQERRKKKVVVSWVLIKDRKSEDKQQGAQLSLSSGDATGAEASSLCRLNI